MSNETMAYQIKLGSDISAIRQMQEKLSGLAGAIKGLATLGGIAVLQNKMRTSVATGIQYNSKIQEIHRSLSAATGSAGLAAVRFAELHRIAGQSRFNLSELAEVSRQLQIMTDGALSSGSGLKLVADVASGTNAPLASTADALGRVYGQIQAGDPELTRGLQQLVMMGAINATTKNSIEALAQTGGTAQQQWAALAAALARFNDQSGAAAGTFEGVMKRFHESLEQAFGTATRTVFHQTADGVKQLTTSLQDNGAGTALQQLGAHLGVIIGQLTPLFSLLSTNRDAFAALTTVVGAAAAGLATLKITNLLGSLSAWASRSRVAASATDASTVAITAETAALGANTAARTANNAALSGRRVSNLSDSFAPASVGRGTGLLTSGGLAAGVLTGRSTTSDAGNMRSATYTAEALNATVAAEAARAAGMKAGQTYAQTFRSNLKNMWEGLKAPSQQGAMLKAAGGALAVGMIGKEMIDAQTAKLEAANAAWEELDESETKYVKGVRESIGALSSVAEKAELIKNVNAQIAETQSNLGKSRYSDEEKGRMQAHILELQNQLKSLAINGPSDSELNDRNARKTYEANAARNQPLSDQLGKEEKQKDEQSDFEDALEGAETYAEKLRIVQAELDRTKKDIADMGDVESRDGDEGYEQEVQRFEMLQDKRRVLRRQRGRLTRESTQDSAEKASRMAEYQLELKIFNLRTQGNHAGARAAEMELEIRKKMAEFLPTASGETADERKANAAKMATDFVQAESAFNLSQKLPPGHIEQQYNSMERVGLGGKTADTMVGNVTDAIARKGAEAAANSAKILSNILTWLQSPKPARQAVWGEE